MLFKLEQAIIINIVYGLVLLSILSYEIAKANKENKLKTIIEHLLIAISVLLISSYIGTTIATIFI
jgi:VIT1/CCC1 family predicted Fe2+/Mn2+ transporter